MFYSADFYGQTTNVHTVSTKRGVNTARISFRTKRFMASAHKIKQINNDRTNTYGTWIDGRRALGTDYSVPRTEIASVQLILNGHTIPVPMGLFSDCYEPNFEKDYFRMKLSDDGKSLVVFMMGSDAAGSYSVFWILRNDGRHSRFSNNVSDLDYGGFMPFFEEQ
jgi:hypothetical protein